MKLLTQLCAGLLFALLAAALPAQGTIDTVGGTTSAPSRAALAKANAFRVDKSVLLLKLEMYLNITGAETLTFFRYRHHSQTGSYVKDWTKVVKVTGSGAAWYSSGVVALPMINGNHYLLGVSWTGTVTYHYSIGMLGQKVSFGSWYSGRTPTGLPPTVTMGGVDRAQYYQRLSSVPLARVTDVGTPCTSPTSPRLVAADLAGPGGAFDLDLVEAPASTPAVFVLVPGKTLATPIPIFGCSLWLNPAGGVLLTLALPTSAGGTAKLKLPIPQDPSLTGFVLAWQTLLIGPSKTALTNAIQFTL